VEQLEDRVVPSADVIVQWNQALTSTALALKTDQGHATRALAMLGLAQFDAVNAIDHSFDDYDFDVRVPGWASKEAAAAQAAHDVLVSLFPARQPAWDGLLSSQLAGVPEGFAKALGVLVGQLAAENILDLRADDGSDAPYIPYTFGTGPAAYQATPPSYGPPILTQWVNVTPFALESGDQFRAPPPPSLTSAEFTDAFNEVKDIGSVNSTSRTALQTEIAHFWDEPAFAQWNEITQNVAVVQNTSLVQNARLFALVNMAMADATIVQFDTKYTYNFVRPVTEIRNADNDGNPSTVADPNWTPLITTPAHPSYQSGHANTGNAAATVLADFFGPNVTFSVGSHNAFIPPGLVHTWTSFAAAAQENAMSRIYGGIHWRFDATVGLATGHATGDYVFQHFLAPRHGRHHPHHQIKDPAGSAHDGAALVSLLGGRDTGHGASWPAAGTSGNHPADNQATSEIGALLRSLAQFLASASHHGHNHVLDQLFSDADASGGAFGGN
jgi:membrane-associated phospholipid phosphatase